jgi:hypothetical protein
VARRLARSGGRGGAGEQEDDQAAAVERKGVGVEELPKWAVHPDTPFLYGQTAGPDYPAQTWTKYSVPWIIRPRSGPDYLAWNSFAQEIWSENKLVCMERRFGNEIGLGKKTNTEWFSALNVARKNEMTW